MHITLNLKSFLKPIYFKGCDNFFMTKKDNMLERVPLRSNKIIWEEREGEITLFIHRNSWFEKIMHKIFKKPEVVKVELEEFGATVWKLCDGNKNIYEISEDLKEIHGEKVEPLIPRLIEYIKMLNNNSFIKFQ